MKGGINALEMARVGIAMALIAAILAISIRTSVRVSDANDVIERGPTLNAVAASGDKTTAYIEGAFQLLVAVSTGVGLYIGTRAFD